MGGLKWIMKLVVPGVFAAAVVWNAMASTECLSAQGCCCCHCAGGNKCDGKVCCHPDDVCTTASGEIFDVREKRAAAMKRAEEMRQEALAAAGGSRRAEEPIDPEPVKKAPEPVKKAPEPVKKAPEPVK